MNYNGHPAMICRTKKRLSCWTCAGSSRFTSEFPKCSLIPKRRLESSAHRVSYFFQRVGAQWIEATESTKPIRKAGHFLAQSVVSALTCSYSLAIAGRFGLPN